MIPKAISDANDAFQAAAQALKNATAAAYPVGSFVKVNLGKATIVGEVESHAPSWGTYEPDQVNLRNVNTGKLRKFRAASDMYEASIIHG